VYRRGRAAAAATAAVAIAIGLSTLEPPLIRDIDMARSRAELASDAEVTAASEIDPLAWRWSWIRCIAAAGPPALEERTFGFGDRDPRLLSSDATLSPRPLAWLSAVRVRDERAGTAPTAESGVPTGRE